MPVLYFEKIKQKKFPWFYLNILLLNPLKTQPGGGYLKRKMSQTFAFTSRRVCRQARGSVA